MGLFSRKHILCWVRFTYQLPKKGSHGHPISSHGVEAHSMQTFWGLMPDASLRIAYMSSGAEVQRIHDIQYSIQMTNSPSMWVPDVSSSEGGLISIEELLEAKELCRTSANLPTSCIHQHIMSKHPELCNWTDGCRLVDFMRCKYSWIVQQNSWLHRAQLRVACSAQCPMLYIKYMYHKLYNDVIRC